MTKPQWNVLVGGMAIHVISPPYSSYPAFYRSHIAFELTHRLYDTLTQGAAIRPKALYFIQLLTKFLEVLQKLKQNIHLEQACQLQGGSVLPGAGKVIQLKVEANAFNC